MRRGLWLGLGLLASAAIAFATDVKDWLSLPKLLSPPYAVSEKGTIYFDGTHLLCAEGHNPYVTFCNGGTPGPGGGTALKTASEIVNCSGPYVETITLAPAGVMVFAVRTEVLQEVNTQFSVGIEEITNAWGTSSGQVGSFNDRTTQKVRNPGNITEFIPIRLTFPVDATRGQVQVTLWYEDYVP